MTPPSQPCSLAAEYLVLLRQLAAAQRRASDLAEAHAQAQRQHEADTARWQAALSGRDALIATLRQHLRTPAPPSLAQRLAACWRQLEQAPALTDRARQAAELVVCQTGCLGHGMPWQNGEDCTRNGERCTLLDAPVDKRRTSPARHPQDS